MSILVFLFYDVLIFMYLGFMLCWRGVVCAWQLCPEPKVQEKFCAHGAVQTFSFRGCSQTAPVPVKPVRPVMQTSS